MNTQATILLFFWALILVSGFQFEDANQAGVEFGDKTDISQKIIVDESNQGGRANLVLITGVTQTLTVNVNSPFIEIFGVDKEDTSDSTQKLLSANILDYEALKSDSVQTSYSIDVIEGVNLTTMQTLSVSIKNLDDESPIIIISECILPESTEITADNSSCQFEISDKDGFLSTIDYTIIGVNGENDIFGFEYRTPPTETDQTADVYLVLTNGTLDYETRKFYSFILQAKDAGGHSTIPSANVTILVEVEDLPDQPPMWDQFTSFKIISENEESTIQVHAIDGDFGINNDINYRINDLSGKNFVSIDQTTGLITIEAIDRDQGNDVIEFEVTAFEVQDIGSSITDAVIINVEDVDDNSPIINVRPSTIAVEEGSSSLEIDISVSDIDKGDNASYSIALINGIHNFNQAFTVQPNIGFANSSVILNVAKPELLDYENVTWKVITLQLQTVGLKTPDNNDSANITIHLLDINDEFPQFSSPGGYLIEVKETVAIDHVLTVIEASDKDEEDKQKGLMHEIVGSWGNSNFAIDEHGGKVTTIKDNVFNYEIQEQITVDIRATDAANHVATVPLTINVLDVNDETPTFTVEGRIEIAENPPDNTELNVQIVAIDLDTNPNLAFSIDWGQSSAYKDSQPIANAFDDFNPIKVETIPGTSAQQVSAKLTTTIGPIGKTLDYEAFDTIFIQLVISDYNTEANEPSFSNAVAIYILDANDHPPVIQNGPETLEIEENVPVGTLVTTIVAVDEDTEDQVVYSLLPQGNTPSNLLVIDSISGDITVQGPIDCDNPVLYFLVYIVTATDGLYEDSAILNVTIKDVNDNVPSVEDVFEFVPEGPTSVGLVASLIIQDHDRDPEFNTVVCSFDDSTSTTVTNTFEINGIDILIKDGVLLDRESIAQYAFNLLCVDNPNNVGDIQNTANPHPKVNIILEDINDNFPNIINTEILGVVNETFLKDDVVDVLRGFDADEGNNGAIVYMGIIETKRYLTLDDIDDNPLEDPPQDLFYLEPITGTKDATLYVNNALSGFYGFLVLRIYLADRGEIPLLKYVDVIVQVVQVETTKFHYISKL